MGYLNEVCYREYSFLQKQTEAEIPVFKAG